MAEAGAPTAAKVDRFTAIPEEDRTCVTACCCYHWALYFKWPNCCGGEESCECCCCETSCSFKCLDFSKRCMKYTGQCLCCDSRISLPCDSEVPCEISVLGLVCYKKKYGGGNAPVTTPTADAVAATAVSTVPEGPDNRTKILYHTTPKLQKFQEMLINGMEVQRCYDQDTKVLSLMKLSDNGRVLQIFREDVKGGGDDALKFELSTLLAGISDEAKAQFTLNSVKLEVDSPKSCKVIVGLINGLINGAAAEGQLVQGGLTTTESQV